METMWDGSSFSHLINAVTEVDMDEEELGSFLSDFRAAPKKPSANPPKIKVG